MRRLCLIIALGVILFFAEVRSEEEVKSVAKDNAADLEKPTLAKDPNQIVGRQKRYGYGGGGGWGGGGGGYGGGGPTKVIIIKKIIIGGGGGGGGGWRRRHRYGGGGWGGNGGYGDYGK